MWIEWERRNPGRSTIANRDKVHSWRVANHQYHRGLSVSVEGVELEGGWPINSLLLDPSMCWNAEVHAIDTFSRLRPRLTREMLIARVASNLISYFLTHIRDYYYSKNMKRFLLTENIEIIIIMKSGRLWFIHLNKGNLFLNKLLLYLYNFTIFLLCQSRYNSYIKGI